MIRIRQVWSQRVALTAKSNIVVWLISFLFASPLIAYGISAIGIKAGLAALILFTGLLISILSLLSSQFGVVFIIASSSFTFIIARIIDADLPFGVLFEILIYITFIGTFFSGRKRLLGLDRADFFSNPFHVAFILWVFYSLIQVFNPNATALDGWLRGLRFLLSTILMYVVFYSAFQSKKYVILFTKVWLVIALLAAIYSLFQEIFGLPFYDYRWVTKNELRVGLNWIGGRWRKWSFMADSSVFGVFMAASGVFCIVLSQGKIQFAKKIVLFLMGIMMLVAMSFSGTRTAYIVVPVGLSIYILLTIQSRNTKYLIIATILSLLFILYAPIYNPIFYRIKTAFNPTEDASYIVREENRAFIRPFIHANPMGGGINTVGTMGLEYSPTHELAGFPPDSQFLHTALEYGWIGLLLTLVISLVVIILGINNYYKAVDSDIKILYAAYLSFYFAMTIACYAKNAIFSYPVGFVYTSIHILMHVLFFLQDRESRNDILPREGNDR